MTKRSCDCFLYGTKSYSSSEEKCPSIQKKYGTHSMSHEWKQVVFTIHLRGTMITGRWTEHSRSCACSALWVVIFWVSIIIVMRIIYTNRFIYVYVCVHMSACIFLHIHLYIIHIYTFTFICTQKPQACQLRFCTPIRGPTNPTSCVPTSGNPATTLLWPSVVGDIQQWFTWVWVVTTCPTNLA